MYSYTFVTFVRHFRGNDLTLEMVATMYPKGCVELGFAVGFFRFKDVPGRTEVIGSKVIGSV